MCYAETPICYASATNIKLDEPLKIGNMSWRKGLLVVQEHSYVQIDSDGNKSLVENCGYDRDSTTVAVEKVVAAGRLMGCARLSENFVGLSRVVGFRPMADCPYFFVASKNKKEVVPSFFSTAEKNKYTFTGIGHVPTLDEIDVGDILHIKEERQLGLIWNEGFYSCKVAAK